MSTSGMIIDGVAASEAIDSSGEILSVDGCDISDLENGVGVLNWEHRGEDAAGASANDIIGKIVFAKKIFKRSECDNEREKMYWDQVKLPFIYIKCRLFDGSGHPGAVAAAAMIRDYHNNGENILVRYSIEGSTLEKDGNNLKRSLARRVAATIKPCNKSCHSGVLSDPNSPAGEKIKDPLEDVEKNEFEHPGFMRLGGAREFECDPWVRDVGAVDDVNKALTAGSYDVAPSHLTGGAALQVEDPERQRKKILEMFKNDVKAAVRDWDGLEDLRRFLKHRLPETDPNFIDRFAELVEDYKLKKAEKPIKDEQPIKSKSSRNVKAKKEPAKAPELAKIPGRDMPTIPSPPSKRAVKEPIYAPSDIKAATPVKLGTSVFTEGEGKSKKRVEKKIVVGAAHQHFATHIPGPRATPTSAADSYFDEQTGYLHTHVGSFKMHIPSDDEYRKVLENPEITKHHDEAVKQWKNLHKLLKTGKLPQEVVMHAALFSAMSPSAGVPYQEFGYSHLVDLMNKHGMNPMVPGGVTPEHRKEFMSRVVPGANKYPEHEQEHWKGPAGNPIRLKNAQKEKGLKAGDTGGLFGPGSKFDSVVDYHHMHKYLVDMLGRHGSNVAAIASELLQHKAHAKLYNARKENKERDNAYQEDSHGPSVDGFANKTVRYLLGMMGGGNIHVPDTHFIRHTFNLPQDDEIIAQAQKEMGGKWDDSKHVGFAPNDALKGILWKSHNHEIGEAMDRYYAKNHPAAKHVRERHFSKPDEDGFKWDDDAHIFPSFWKHWLSIEPHEQAQGKRTDHQNAGTDHRVFWNAVNHVLKKYNLPHNEMIKSEGTPNESPMLERIAAAHAHVNRMFGDNAGNFFYYHTLVPMLIGEARKRESKANPETMIRKFEALVITLRKEMDNAGVPLKKPRAKRVPAHKKPENRDKMPMQNRAALADVEKRHGKEQARQDKFKDKKYAAGKESAVRHADMQAMAAPARSEILPRKDEYGNTYDAHASRDTNNNTKPPRVTKPAPAGTGDYLTDASWEMGEHPVKLRQGDNALVQQGLDINEGAVKFGKHIIKPGLVEGIAPKIKGKKFHLIFANNQHAVVAPFEEGIGGPRRKWNMGMKDTHFKVVQPHQILNPSSLKIDHDKHGIHEINVSEEQKALLHGTDLGDDPIERGGEGGINAHLSHWRKMANGKDAYIKKDPQRIGYGHDEGIGDISEPRREVLYTNIGRHLGLGQYMPNCAAFKHPETGDEHVAIEGIDDAEHFTGEKHQISTLKHYGQKGELDKLATMNMLMGNHDRHGMNWMISDKGPHMIDHGLAFIPMHYGVTSPPHYWQKYHENEHPGKSWQGQPMHPEALKWIDGIDHSGLMEEMKRQGADPRYIYETGKKLTALKKLREVYGDALTKGQAFYASQGKFNFAADVHSALGHVRDEWENQGQDESYEPPSISHNVTGSRNREDE